MNKVSFLQWTFLWFATCLYLHLAAANIVAVFHVICVILRFLTLAEAAQVALLKLHQVWAEVLSQGTINLTNMQWTHERTLCKLFPRHRKSGTRASGITLSLITPSKALADEVIVFVMHRTGVFFPLRCSCSLTIVCERKTKKRKRGKNEEEGKTNDTNDSRGEKDRGRNKARDVLRGGEKWDG